MCAEGKGTVDRPDHMRGSTGSQTDTDTDRDVNLGTDMEKDAVTVTSTDTGTDTEDRHMCGAMGAPGVGGLGGLGGLGAWDGPTPRIVKQCARLFTPTTENQPPCQVKI